MKLNNVLALDKTIKWSFIIFLVAFGLRVIFLLQFQSVLLFSHPIVDLAYHHKWAEAIAHGQEYFKGPFFRAPLYPAFLGMVYMLLGDNPWIIRIIQALIGSFSAVLVFVIGIRTFNFKTGFLAGLGMAAYGTIIFYDAQLLVPNLAIFLTLIALYFLVKIKESIAFKNLFWGGFFLGLSAIARPTILLFAMLFFLWLIWKRVKGNWTLNIKHLLVFVVAIIIPILPVTIYNYIQSGEFILIGAYGGINFYVGNYNQADGVSPILPNTRRDWWGGKEDTKRIAEADVGHKLSEAEQSRYWFQKTLKEIYARPKHFIKLLFRKTILLFEGNELSNNFDIYYFAHQTVLMKLLIWRGLVFFPWGLVFPLAICGLILALPFNHQRQIIALFLLGYFPAIVLFLVTARYRLPMVPILILFASFGIISFARNFRKFSLPKIISIIFIFIALFIISNSDLYGYGKKNNAQAYHSVATIYASQGNWKKAEKYYRKALVENPYLSETSNDLALLLASKGDYNESINIINRSLKKNPTDLMLRYNLGYLYLEDNKPQKAISPLKAAIKTKPDFLYALNNLGLAYMRMGRFDSALVPFHQAIAVDPKFANAYYNLAITFNNRKQWDSARYYYEKTLQLDSSIYNVYYQLGWLWLKQNKVDSSLINFKRYLRYAPPNAKKTKQIIPLVDSLSKR
ncbi:MAG: tetratricopeptide repeat protein [FCB group bacterium]|nr:tetratricopeptide repeat protein [FCB group bacterium]